MVLQQQPSPGRQAKPRAGGGGAAKPERANGLERKVEGLASNLAKVVEQLGNLHVGSLPPGSGAKPPARAAAAAGAEPGPPKDETYKVAQAKVDKMDGLLKKVQELDLGAEEEARAKGMLAAAKKERDALKTPCALFMTTKTRYGPLCKGGGRNQQ